MPRVSASWARWPPESRPARWVGVEAEPLDAVLRRARRPSAGLSWAPRREVVGHAQPGVRRGVLADVADLGALGVAAGRAGAEHLDLARPTASACPTARLRKVLLPAPLGPTSPTTRPAGTSRVQSESAHLRPYFLPRPAGLQHGAHAVSSAHRGAKRGQEQRLDALLVEPGPRAFASHCSRLSPERSVRGEGVVGRASGSRRCRPPAAPRPALVLELAVGLEHGVGVDRQLADDVLDGRQLVPLAAAGRAAGRGAPAGPAGGTARRLTWPSRWNSIIGDSISLGT